MIREHLSQHERADDLPLVTESASVTDVTVMDDDRKDEVATAAEQMADEYGVEWEGDDWDAVADALPDDARTKFEKLRGRYGRPYPSLISIRFRADEEFDFVAGQYVTVRFHDTPRPYSLASSPNDDETELCIKRVPTGSLTTEIFEDLDIGDEITVRGPNGDFMLQEPSERDIVFLATGTGVAPLRSMIRYTFQEGRDVYEGETRDVWLFLGASWEDDLPYRDEFERLDDERRNFHFVPTLSRESYLTDWDGETEYVQDALVKYIDGDETADGAGLDADSMDVYACGVSAMVNSVVDAVREAGVPEERIEAEGYG